MRAGVVWTLGLVCLASPVWPETVLCEETNVSVSARRSENAEMACAAVKHAEALFAQCEMPPLDDPLRIEIVDEMSAGCVALYHCGEGLIEVLEPPLMEKRRSSGDAFAFLAIESYFPSAIVHELSHTLFDDVPCPFESCVSANEYVAYAMQIMSLTPEQQAEFTANSDLDERVSRDELSSVILFMAPSVFARKSWAHLSQRDDPCAYIGQILEGSILLDYDRF